MPEERGRRIVIKIGGSVITEKTIPYKPRTKTIGRLAKEIRSILSHYSMGIVHGGGSFGHYSVKEVLEEYGVLDYRGYYHVTWSMDILNRLVLDKLVEAKVPAVSIPPRSICYYECTTNTYKCNMDTVARLTNKGLSPLLYGDLVTVKGECNPKVLSGDVIVYQMAEAIGAERVIFMVRAPGIYVEEDGKRFIIRRVPLESIDRVIEKAKRAQADSGYVDVTSGIIGKLEAIKKGMGETRVSETIILPGEPPGALHEYLLRGKREIGTIIIK